MRRKSQTCERAQSGRTPQRKRKMQHALLAFGLLPSVPPHRAAAAASAGRVAISPRMATDVNPSIAAATPCDFPWWSDACSTLIADLDAKGGERFVASHDDEGFDTRNWLHVRRTPTQESTPGYTCMLYRRAALSSQRLPWPLTCNAP